MFVYMDGISESCDFFSCSFFSVFKFSNLLSLGVYAYVNSLEDDGKSECEKLPN